ncbi:hypothetical protein [Sulfitobacter sp. EhC04]|uniref:hypothetical protein n=1 Tax=Sulfitobacter sp. EhC04 TaxID=1849168 RepID=UPI000AED343A|nr:hypothetical protein [Sulfitobacter sp. EhC04]
MSGFRVFAPDPATLRWAQAAHRLALDLANDPAVRADNLRHGDTWFVGVDALPNAPDGSIAGVPLDGPWRGDIAPPDHWHRAQLSIVYPGYPGKDPSESDANHQFRINRHAAHVDGLLPEGPARRRFLREPHGFILGLPLNHADAAPLVVWPGSHRIMGDTLRRAIGDRDPGTVDLTDAYGAARRVVFDAIDPVQVLAEPGQATLLHRHLLHGVAPWAKGETAPPEGRMIAYFRPQISASAWLNG